MGIIKTAMYSGAAMYGVKQIAKTAESHRNNSNNSPARNQVDPEYLEWLEWKRRSAQSAPPTTNRSMREPAYGVDEPEYNARGYQSGQQQLYLAPASDLPPSYGYPYANNTESSARTGYQPLEFTYRQSSGFIEPESEGDVKSSRGRLDFESLVGQGMNMLQARRGSDQFQGGDFVSKLMKK